MKLTAKHMALIELIADPLDMRTNAQKAEAVGFSDKTLYRMLKVPEAIELINKRTTEMVPTGRPEALRCLVRGFQAGDRASATDFLKVTGDIGTGGVNVQTNVTQTTSDEAKLPDRIRSARERRELALGPGRITGPDRN